MRRIILVIFCLMTTLSITSIVYASDTDTNADMLQIRSGNTYGLEFIIIPNDTSQYKYLFKYPVTAFTLLYQHNTSTLTRISSRNLKFGNIGSDILLLNKIAGCEDLADEVIGKDEFDIEARKPKIVSRLQGCLLKLKEEYMQYLNGVNGTYKFIAGDYKYRYGTPSGYSNTVRVSKPDDICNTISKDSYDLDKRILTIRPIYTTRVWWGRLIKDNYDKKYKKDYPSMKVALNLEDAKKIFSGEGRTCTVTILEVKTKYGTLTGRGTGGATDYLQNIEILNMKTLFYRYKSIDGNHLPIIDEFNKPVLIIDIESNSNRPLS